MIFYDSYEFYIIFLALTRSHTHGSFARSRTTEESSEEWWASEKAKKLSPKRFDTSDIKFKKVNNIRFNGNLVTGSAQISEVD